MTERDAGRHRFFRTMVLMGSSIALSCGGATEESKSTAAGGSGGGGSGGAGGKGGSGGVGGSSGRGGSGGSMMAGTGGSGGIIVGGSGGVAGMPPDAGPFECHPAQWECGELLTEQCRNDENGWRLPENCTCNTGRPRSSTDCAGTTELVCLLGGYSSDGQKLREPVPFQCSCQPKRETCHEECSLAFASGNPSERYACEFTNPDAGHRDVLCGCAVVVLL